MAEHEHSVSCPMCGVALEAATDTELIGKIQAHGKQTHGMDLTAEQAREMTKAGAD